MVRECIEVDTIDWTTTEDGEYKEDYRGRYVYDKSTDTLYFFANDGRGFAAVYPMTSTKGEIWSPKEIFDLLMEKSEQPKEDLKAPEEISRVKRDILDLLLLKDKFSADDLVKLREAGLL